MKNIRVLLACLLLCTLFIAGCEWEAPAESDTQPSVSAAESTGTAPTAAATEPTVPAQTTASEPTDSPTTATEPTTAPTAPAHVHSFSAATCTAPKTCACGATEGTANGHNWNTATCTAPKTCKSCGVTEGSAKGHSWKEATYTAPKTCSACKATEGNPLDVPGKENYHGHVYTGGNYSTKYHYEADCAGKNSHEITWEDVERRKLGPCGTCVLK